MPAELPTAAPAEGAAAFAVGDEVRLHGLVRSAATTSSVP